MNEDILFILAGKIEVSDEFFLVLRWSFLRRKWLKIDETADFIA